MAAEARKAASSGEAPPIETIIKLLSTWKPGQPWPAGIPPPPPGWKPGDPLHIGAAPTASKAKAIGGEPPGGGSGKGVGRGEAGAEPGPGPGVGTGPGHGIQIEAVGAAAGAAAVTAAAAGVDRPVAAKQKQAPIIVVPFIQLDLNPDMVGGDTR